MKRIALIIWTLSLLLITGCDQKDTMVSNTLFETVDSSHSQITFNNIVKDTPLSNIMIYSNFYGGAGVGVGDLNNDGLTDIYFAGNQVADALYMNRGDLQFEDITSEAGIIDNGGWSSGVLIADINQDGYNDIYVTRELYDDQPELRRNLLYINNGSGEAVPSFTEQAAFYGIDDNQRTRHASFIDYDKDGDLDLFLLNQPPNPGDYSTYYNAELLTEEYRPKLLAYTGQPQANGTGGFKDVSVEAGLTKTGFPNSVTASDLNGDGWTDLYVANDFEAGDWYYINNGDGTFTDKAQEYVKHTSFSSMGVDAADMNNDGLLDVSVVDMAAEDNYRSKANMSGMNPKAFWNVVSNGGHHQYMFNTLQMNTGEGRMSDMAQLGGVATTDWSWSILLADFDNDQWKDIFITNGLLRDIRNNDAAKVLPTYIESALFEYLKNNPNPKEGTSVWDIVDIDSTLALVPSERLQNFVYKNEGDLTYSKKMEEWGLTEKTFSNGASYADLDNDGDLDLIVSNINDVVSIYKNTASESGKGNYLRINPVPEKGKSTLGVKCWITTTEGEQFFEVTGVRGMYSTSESMIHFGLGELSEVISMRLLWPDGRETNLNEIAANQTLDINYKDASPASSSRNKENIPLLSVATSSLGVDYKHEENKFDDYNSQVLLPHKMSTFGPMMTKGDVNGDQLDDVYIGGAINQSGTLLLQNANGTFSSSIPTTFQNDKRHEDMGASFFDVDGDGDLDLYVVSGGNEYRLESTGYQDRLYINDGQGNFKKENNRIPDLRISGSKVKTHDFDQDGDIDLFIGGRHIPWAYPEPASSVLLINENGSFVKASDKIAKDLENLGLVNDAVWTDYNRDGWADLIVVGEWMPLTIFQNNEGKSLTKTTSKTDQATEGWWFSIETADIDGDGDEDLIAGNLGLNYKYKATEEEPFEVYYDDFDGNQSKDIVLTYYNYGIQYPLRGRQCSSEQIPEIKEKMPTYDLFASSDAKSVYGDAALENALHYKASTFASAYFENQGDGSFKMHKLPNSAQISSVNDIIVDDFNNDKKKDILLAGNLYNAEVETTRNDAGYGLLLLGDGTGEFKEVPSDESGFYVPFNVKSMEHIETKSGQLVFVGCNDEELKIYKKL